MLGEYANEQRRQVATTRYGERFSRVRILSHAEYAREWQMSCYRGNDDGHAIIVTTGYRQTDMEE